MILIGEVIWRKYFYSKGCILYFFCYGIWVGDLIKLVYRLFYLEIVLGNYKFKFCFWIKVFVICNYGVVILMFC